MHAVPMTVSPQTSGSFLPPNPTHELPHQYLAIPIGCQSLPQSPPGRLPLLLMLLHRHSMQDVGNLQSSFMHVEKTTFMHGDLHWIVQPETPCKEEMTMLLKYAQIMTLFEKSHIFLLLLFIYAIGLSKATAGLQLQGRH